MNPPPPPSSSSDNNNNSSSFPPPTPPSPARLTKRSSKGVKYSFKRSSPDAASRVGGETTINIVNNFGMGSINHFTDAASTVGKNKNQQQIRTRRLLSWCMLRSCLTVILVLWGGAMMALLRSSSDGDYSSETANEAPLGSSSVRGTKKHKKSNRKGWFKKAKSKLQSSSSSSSNNNSQTNTGTSTTPEPSAINYEDLPSSTTAFGEDVAYSLAHPNVFRSNTPHAPSCQAPLDVADISFTLVSQLSFDRIWMIAQHCERWGNHPISVAVFSNRNATEVKADAVANGCTEEQLMVQTVNRAKYDPSGTEYPVNILRNLALSAVTTSHVVYADVDFWPASNLYSILSQPSVKERMASDPYLATVIPAFQMIRQCHAFRDCKDKNIPVMPKNKEALLELVDHRKASSFDPTNKGGHGSTKYATWKQQEEGTFVDLPCINSNRYEPYLAVRYCDKLPPFQEGFTGYGKNKMSWAMQLRRSNYQFSQLGGAFLIHYPHLDSKARMEWNKKPDLLHETPLDKLDGTDKEKIDWQSFKRARVDALFIEFRKWLGTITIENGKEPRVPMCDDAPNDDVKLWVHPAMIDR